LIGSRWLEPTNDQNKELIKEGNIKENAMSDRIRNLSTTRRNFLAASGAIGAALATGIYAPAVRAQANKPVKLGVVLTTSGGLATHLMIRKALRGQRYCLSTIQ
jgi:hypothetical protein